MQDFKWDQILDTLNTEEKWECFRSILIKGITECIPMGNKYRRTKVKPGWLNHDIKSQRTKKTFKKFKAKVSLSAFQHYNECNKECKNSISTTKKDWETHSGGE